MPAHWQLTSGLVLLSFVHSLRRLATGSLSLVPAFAFRNECLQAPAFVDLLLELDIICDCASASGAKARRGRRLRRRLFHEREDLMGGLGRTAAGGRRAC